MYKSILMLLMAIVSGNAMAEWVENGGMPDASNQGISAQTQAQGESVGAGFESLTTPDQPAQKPGVSAVPALDENLMALKQKFGGGDACSDSVKFSNAAP